MTEFSRWLDRHTGREFLLYAKRLSGNDTLANGSHQAGPYIPKEVLFRAFRSLRRHGVRNPDVRFELSIDSHPDQREVRAIWYNNRLFGGTRNEARVTGFGGRDSALLAPDSTGAVAALVFRLRPGADCEICRAWVCRTDAEENELEDRIGPIEPGDWISIPQIGPIGAGPTSPPPRARRRGCWLGKDDIPEEWLSQYPSGEELIRKSIELRPQNHLLVDKRLLMRRQCEYTLFRSLEHAVEWPQVQAGFQSIGEFIARAQSILQRRKARSGRSLELHAKELFLEEGLRQDVDFTHQPETEPGRRPDFIFPSAERYRDSSVADGTLRMLAVKTTCKDRWRQILNEAERVERKHLLTLQEGVSEAQFREMQQSGVQLVVPQPLVSKYPSSVQPSLQNLAAFIEEVRGLIE